MYGMYAGLSGKSDQKGRRVMTKNIILIGVGGQGSITASKVLTLGLLEAGFDVKMSEIHGMSQRGGSVLSQVRYGVQVASPVIEPGTADMIVAFEKMEALRALPYLKKDGIVVVNDHRMDSIPIQLGKFEYPDDVYDTLNRYTDRLIIVPASQIAREMGNPRATNMILLGTMIKAMSLENVNWEKILKENTKQQFVQSNLKAIDEGMKQL